MIAQSNNNYQPMKNKQPFIEILTWFAMKQPKPVNRRDCSI